MSPPPLPIDVSLSGTLDVSSEIGGRDKSRDVITSLGCLHSGDLLRDLRVALLLSKTSVVGLTSLEYYVSSVVVEVLFLSLL